MNGFDKINVIVNKKKKSGTFLIFLSIILMIIIIPLLLYGIFRASFNGISWINNHNERKLHKLDKKNRKLSIEQEIKDKKKSNRKLRLNKKISKVDEKNKKVIDNIKNRMRKEDTEEKFFH